MKYPRIGIYLHQLLRGRSSISRKMPSSRAVSGLHRSISPKNYFPSQVVPSFSRLSIRFWGRQAGPEGKGLNLLQMGRCLES